MSDLTVNLAGDNAQPADLASSSLAGSKNEKKYFLAVVREHELSADGREHRIAMLIAASNQEEADKIHREAARHWYSTDDDESPTPGHRFDNPCWDYENGSFAGHPVRVELQECDVISAADYLVLRKYGACVWDLTRSDSPEWARESSDSENRERHERTNVRTRPIPSRSFRSDE